MRAPTEPLVRQRHRTYKIGLKVLVLVLWHMRQRGEETPSFGATVSDQNTPCFDRILETTK